MRDVMPVLSELPLAITLAVYVAGGFVAGWVYFASVKRSAEALATSSSPLRALVEALLRFGLLSGALLLVSWQGALPLLASTGGLVIARQALLRGNRETAQ